MAGLAAEFMSLNGCRIGELSALQIQHYDKDNRVIKIHGSYDKFIDDQPGTTKTEESYRTVPLTNKECEILEKAWDLKQGIMKKHPNTSRAH